MASKSKSNFEVAMAQEGNYLFIDFLRDEKPNRMYMDTVNGDMFYGTPYNANIRVADAKYVAIFMYHAANCDFAAKYLSLMYQYLLRKCR